MAALTVNTLITGATGFVGGRLAEALVGDGESVRLYTRDRSRLPVSLTDQADILEGDLSNSEAIGQAVSGVDVVIHCAANVNTWDTWKAYESANITGVRNLLEAIQRHCPALKRLVHLSTVDVYGYPDKPCNESCPLSGGGFGYGESKLAGELLVRESGLPFTILRPSNIFGPGSLFVSRIGDALRHGVMLKIDGGHTNAGLIYIDNLVAYTRWAATNHLAANAVFNVRDDYDVSWADYLDRLKRLIRGRGIVLNQPFGVADGFAKALAFVHRRWLPDHEPLLHPLLVRMFGRTCGHPATKLHAAASLSALIGFDEAMERSAKWYLDR